MTLDEALARIAELEKRNADLQGRLLLAQNAMRVARHVAKERGADLMADEAVKLLHHFRDDYEPLRDIAPRSGLTPSALVHRARALQRRGLVESVWDTRGGYHKVWRKTEGVVQYARGCST